MAEAVVTWVLEEIGVEFASWIAAAIVETASYVAIAASVYNLREQQRRAKNAYNNGLADRYVMQRAATAQRALVLGRARVSGPIVFMHSYGDNNTTLALCVMLAAHECDAIEEIYFNDTAVILDANGAVVGTKIVERFSINGTTATYTLGTAGTAGTASAVATYDTGTVALGVVMSGDGRTLSITGGTAGKVGSVVVTYQPYDVVYTPTRIEDSHLQQTATGSSGTFTVPASCITASVVVVDIPASGAQTVIGFSRAGNVITYTGATAGHTVHLMYQAGTTYSRARITQHLGAPGQTADAGLISALPSLWTSAHRGDGLCYLKVELDYDPSTFPNGIPNISAVVRGLKCFDPRTSTTVWTDNPALLMRAYYLHALGAGRSVSEINDASVIAAANVCDGTVTYTVGAFKQTRARYKGSTVAMKDRRPQDVLTDLAHAMGGRWVVSGNQLVVKAGVFSSPVASIDATWLHTGSSVSVQPRVNRADLTNAIVGSFADEQQAWQVVAYPKVSAAAYITADGAELQARVDYPAVTYTGQAQYLSACAIRYNRAGLTVRMSCNLRAFPLEVFDVVSVTLTRFGWSAKTFEVIATGFSVEGLVELTLKEIDASIWALDAAFLATDYAVKSLLPSPWVLPVPVLGTPVSGTAYLLRQADGSIVSRIYVPVSPITNTNVLQGGFIDVSYRRFGDSNDDWSTVTVPGDATGAFLAGVNDGAVYVIKARTRNRLAEGKWSQQVVHSVVGKSQPPAAVAGFALTVVPGALRGSRTPSAELDYAYSIYVYGASFAAGTRISGTSDKNGFTWPWPAPGSYTIWVADVDTSGNVGTPVSQTVTVDAASVGAGVQLVNDAGITITGNTATKTSGTNGAWDAAFHSRDGFTGGAFVSFVVPVLGYQLGVGLNTTPLTDNTNASVDYLLAVDAAGALSAYERSATAISLSTTAAAGDVLAVVYDGTAVRYLRNGTVLRTVTVSIAAPLFVDSSFFTLGGKVTNIQFGPMTNIAGVTTAAANAQAAADSANATLASIASDNILSANEKPPVMRDYAVITGEQAGIDAQASAYSVTTEKTAYDTAVSALTTYLGTIPGWNVVPGSDVAIVGTTFRQKFQDVYTTRQALLNKIAAVAGTLASWSGVTGSGRPLDNAGKTMDLGAATGVFGARDRNDPPIDYPFGSLRQFKQATAVGLSASDGTYCTLETIIQFTDDSGGPNVQYAYQGPKTWRRYALRTAAAWGAWTQDLDRNAYTGDLNATSGAPAGTYVGGTLAQTVESNASTALSTANTAATNASSALTQLTNIASDSILSPSEKPPVIRDYNVITGEQAGIDAQASAYSITTEKTAYDNAVAALTAYLGNGTTTGLIGWNVLPGSDVAIVGPTFRQKFQDVYTTRQDLLNKIAAAAGTLANWSGVSGTGKPLDNAGKTVDLGAATGVFGARDRNDPPIDYPFGSLRQFKQATAVGLSASDGTYCTLETIIQFTDDSGGPNVQYAYQGPKTWRRYALRTAAAWGAWTQDLDRNAYTGDLAATKNIVTYSTTSPATPADGDIWVNTGVVPAVINVRVGGVWQTGANLSTNTNQLTDGAGLGNTAIWTQVSGTGKPADNATRNQVTYSATAPAAPVDGDLWADTSVVPLVWRVRLSSAWQAAANYVTNTNQVTDGAGLGLTAVWASISGTGKPEDLATRNTVYYQTADPGAVPNGSIWITGGKSYQRVGAAWQPYVGTASVGTGELANQAATEVTQDNYAFAGAGTGSGLITQRSVVYTPPIDCTISFSATIGAAQVLPDSANRLGWSVAAGAGADVTLGSCNSNSGNRQTFACATSFAATAGVALTFKLISDRASTNPAILLYDSSMRIEAIKR